MGDERIDQRAGVVAGGGMDDEPRRLVDDDQVVVLVDDVERDRFACRLGRLGRRQVDDDRFPRFDRPFRLLYRRAADRDRPSRMSALARLRRQVGDGPGEPGVEAHAGVAFADRDLDARDFASCHG